MKITVNVDCTPAVAPLQESMMAQMKAQMEKAATAMDPEAIMKTLFPNVEGGLAGMQKAFWDQFTNRTTKP